MDFRTAAQKVGLSEDVLLKLKAEAFDIVVAAINGKHQRVGTKLDDPAKPTYFEKIEAPYLDVLEGRLRVDVKIGSTTNVGELLLAEAASVLKKKES